MRLWVAAVIATLLAAAPLCYTDEYVLEPWQCTSSQFREECGDESLSDAAGQKPPCRGNCTKPLLVTGLGHSGTHWAAGMLRHGGRLSLNAMPHEKVGGLGTICWACAVRAGGHPGWQGE